MHKSSLKLILGFWLIFTAETAVGRSLEGIEMPETFLLGTKSLALNGMGVRIAQKFGFDIKVYVAGLYLTEKSKDSNLILNSQTPKRLEMIFLRRVDAEKLRDAFKDGMYRNCLEDCENYKNPLNELNKNLSDILKDGKMIFTFYPEAVEFEILGRKTNKGRIEGKAFSKNLLAVFIGSTPPNPGLKQGLVSGTF